MTEENGILTFESDKDSNGNEMINSSQRNNQLVWPSVKEKPKAQYRTDWKNMCNVTCYAMALRYSGWIIPSGPFDQDEDNLAYFILTDKECRKYFKEYFPTNYDLFIRSLDGKCSEKELNDLWFPNELHRMLSEGTNIYLKKNVSSFYSNYNFKYALWNNMVKNNLPLVISTTFGEFNHIVCCTGVQYRKEDYEAASAKTIDYIDPVSIIVDDPWGKYNPETNKYDAPNGGNDIIVPWSRVITNVKPLNSPTVKWYHQFEKGPEVI